MLQLSVRPTEVKLLRLALDRAAHSGEIAAAATKLINSLRSRGISAGELFRGKQPVPAAVDSELAHALVVRMPFGKHRGKCLRDIPADYLIWVNINCSNASVGLRRAIATVLGKK
jgi:putative quorum-sensing-regulated virulence factor